MFTVHHKPKGKSYEYADEQTARERCEQVTAASDGKLKASQGKDGSFTIDNAAKKKGDDE